MNLSIQAALSTLGESSEGFLQIGQPQTVRTPYAQDASHAERDPIGLTAENQASVGILMSHLGFQNVRPALTGGKGKTSDTVGRVVNVSGDRSTSQMDLEEDTFSHAKVAAARSHTIHLRVSIPTQPRGFPAHCGGRRLDRRQRRLLPNKMKDNAAWEDQPAQHQLQGFIVEPTEPQLEWTEPGLVEPLRVKPAPPGLVEPLRVKLDLVVAAPDRQLPCPQEQIQSQVMLQLQMQVCRGQSADQIGNKECDAPGQTLQ